MKDILVWHTGGHVVLRGPYDWEQAGFDLGARVFQVRGVSQRQSPHGLPHRPDRVEHHDVRQQERQRPGSQQEVEHHLLRLHAQHGGHGSWT